MQEDLKVLSGNLFSVLVSFQKKVFNHDIFKKNCEIPPSHMKVLFHIIHMGPSSISEVGKHLEISKPNMTPIIDSLENEGYIRRFNDPNDRRKIQIEPTEKGYGLLNGQINKAKEYLAEKLTTLSAEDVEKLSIITEDLLTILPKIN